MSSGCCGSNIPGILGSIGVHPLGGISIVVLLFWRGEIMSSNIMVSA